MSPIVPVRSQREHDTSIGTLHPPPPPPSDPPACARILFVGLRGSSEPFDQAYQGEGTLGMGSRIANVYVGFITAHGTDEDVRSTAIPYEALGVETLTYSLEDYLNNVWGAVFLLDDLLHDEMDRCPNERFVLSGYSSGALAIHLLLGDPTFSDPVRDGPNSPIAAVVLVADPAKQGDSTEERAGSAAASADGMYTKAFGAPYIPANIAVRTITECHDNDIVCAPGVGSGLAQHNYQSDELRNLGLWAAFRVPGAS